MQGADWNYGSNFGGPLKATWTSGADTVHDGGVGMFGTFGKNPFFCLRAHHLFAGEASGR